jgi:hypothetical protein
MNEPQYRAKIINLEDVPPADPEHRRAVEAAYRRGVAQTLSLAARLVHDGADAEDLEDLVGLAMQMRHDREDHPTFLDDLRRRRETNEKE